MKVIFCIRFSSCRIRLSTNKVCAKNVMRCILDYNKMATVRKRTVRVRIRTVILVFRKRGFSVLDYSSRNASAGGIFTAFRAGNQIPGTIMPASNREVMPNPMK